MPPVRPPPADFLPGVLTIERGTPRDYFALEHFHYARKRPATYAGVWVARYAEDDRCARGRVVAAAVLSYPFPRCFARERYLGLRIAAARFAEHITFLNTNVRTISRVVVHPQFRATGLATSLIRRILDDCPTRYVEASAVMARAHPLFDAAGMKRLDPPPGDERKPVYFIFDKEGSPCDSDVTK
jgi:GNAT superfamily N-acetyltransferase